MSLCQCGCGKQPPLYRRSDSKRGVVKGQQAPFMRGHYLRQVREGGRFRKPDGYYQERFHAHYERRGDDECWLWTGPKKPNGYGAVLMGDRTTPHLQAHRVAYELAFGLIGSGLCVCHRCDQRNCVNPKHLFLGTNSDNMRDAAAKGRLSVPKPKSRKVSDDQVAEIRALVASGLSQRIVRERFGLSSAFISQVIAGKRRHGIYGVGAGV